MASFAKLLKAGHTSGFNLVTAFNITTWNTWLATIRIVGFDLPTNGSILLLVLGHLAGCITKSPQLSEPVVALGSLSELLKKAHPNLFDSQ